MSHFEAIRLNVSTRRSSITKLSRVAAGLLGALLALFGTAPLVSTLLSDVRPGLGDATPFFVTIALLGAVVAVLAANKACSCHNGNKHRDVARFGRITATMLIVAALAVSFLSWERDNLTSWRMAERFEAGPDVLKTRTSKHGTQLVQLNMAGARGPELALGSVQLPRHLGVSGGLLDLAIRSSGGSKADECAPILEPRVTSAGIAETVFTLRTHCDGWSRAQVEVQPGSKLLELRAVVASTQVTGVEIGFESASVRFSLLWSALTAISFALLLSCVLYVVSDSLDEAVATVKSSRAPLQWKRHYTYWAVASGFLFLAVANVGVNAFVAKERTIYAWDFGGHWMSAVNVSRAVGLRDRSTSADDAGDSPNVHSSQADSTPADRFWDRPGPVASVLRSIRYWEYNVTAAIPLAIPMNLAGGTRVSYELSLVNVYALSSVLVLMLFIWTVARERQSHIPAAWPLVPSVAVLLFNPFWVPLLRGYVGVCVVVINLFVYWLYFRRNVNDQRLTELFLISVFLAVSVVMRRWNAYWVVAFFVIASIDVVVALVESRRISVKRIVHSFSGILVIGLGAVTVLAVLAWPLVVTILTTDYADIYSAYADSGGSVGEHVGHFVRTHGIGLIVLTLIAILYLLRRARYRKLSLLLTTHLVIVLVHVSSTQEMGPHHMYLLMPAALILLGLASQEALSRSSAPIRASAIALVVAYLANGILSNIAVFAPTGDSLRQALVPLVPDNRRAPLVRHDIDEFGRLASFLDLQVASLEPDARIYVLASSPVFNVATLNMLEVSTGISFKAKDRLLRTADVDKRDGFPKGIFEAEIVAVASPVQFHHEPEEQQVIGIPAEMILLGTGIGGAFELLPETFELDDGVLVHVYRRLRANSPEERAELSNRLRVAYPDRPAVYGR